ncbi:MAG: PAS domain S-box protein, partial [Gammaproteobacteria bacterium]|nr:PAS domain S-box protein [Gammaproteobacteria bacterium]
RVSEEHFRNLVEGSLQGILIHNLEDVLFVNQTLLDIFGYASLDEIRTAYAERRIIATHDSERIREFAEARLAGSEGPQRYELDAVKADGSLMQIEASGRRINWQGRPALQTTVLDITERKRAERALQSELRRNQIVLKSSQDGFFTCDLNGKLRDVNRAYERMLGYAPGEMAGMDLADIEANKSPTEVAESLARIAREGQGFFEVKHRHKQGFTVDFEVSVAAAIIDEDPFIFSFMRDVTDRNKALADLRESQAQLHALTMLAPAGIFRTDKDGRTTYVNEHWSELTGIATSKPGGDDWTYFLHEEDRERVLKHWRDRLASRTVFRDEYRYQRPQGSLVWVYCVANPQYNQQAEFTGYIGALTNITARKQAQAELENYRDHLEELVDARTAELRTAVREQESFSYSVSHDLRSPLRTIDGFSHMLLDEYSEVLDAEGKQCLQRVRAASQRMGLLIDALLNLSRMSRRKMRYETVDVSEIANDIVRRLRRTDPERDAQIEVAEELRAKGDSALLRVVLENLLNNAWKYSNKQTHTRIEVARIDGRGSGFLVRDNGVGFDMRYADRLFKPFQRLHTFEEFEGTGIGLATVVRIIERHGGKVWAESEEGKGATFYFTV